MSTVVYNHSNANAEKMHSNNENSFKKYAALDLSSYLNVKAEKKCLQKRHLYPPQSIAHQFTYNQCVSRKNNEQNNAIRQSRLIRLLKVD